MNIVNFKLIGGKYTTGQNCGTTCFSDDCLNYLNLNSVGDEICTLNNVKPIKIIFKISLKWSGFVKFWRSYCKKSQNFNVFFNLKSFLKQSTFFNVLRLILNLRFYRTAVNCHYESIIFFLHNAKSWNCNKKVGKFRKHFICR